MTLVTEKIFTHNWEATSKIELTKTYLDEVNDQMLHFVRKGTSTHEWEMAQEVQTHQFSNKKDNDRNWKSKSV